MNRDQGALYFLFFQNLVYVNIVYSALYELSDGNPTKYPFELFLFVFMVASIVSGMEWEHAAYGSHFVVRSYDVPDLL
jgi:hypothetical protein